MMGFVGNSQFCNGISFNNWWGGCWAFWVQLFENAVSGIHILSNCAFSLLSRMVDFLIHLESLAHKCIYSGAVLPNNITLNKDILFYSIMFKPLDMISLYLTHCVFSIKSVFVIKNPLLFLIPKPFFATASEGTNYMWETLASSGGTRLYGIQYMFCIVYS